VDESTRKRMTVQQALQSVGGWVAVMPWAAPAILMKAYGVGVTVRFTGAPLMAGLSRSRPTHYQTINVDSCVRRPDWDARPKPKWWTPKVEAEVASHTETDPGVIDKLTYRSYRQQRLLYPEKAYTRWAAIFDNVEALEAQFREEQELAQELDDRVRQDAQGVR
jgi:hypothetical protein